MRWLFLYLPLLLVLALVAGAAYAWHLLGTVGRVEVADVLDARSGDAMNVLLVGSDSRDGIDPNAPDAGALGEVDGKRADTIIVLRITSAGSSMMSVPRDLWTTNAATGEKGKINGAYNQGPANLITTVRSTLGVPIHHYVEIGFVSFAGMVDALGGVTIDVPHPATDPKSGLDIPEAGPNVLDGQQALAYVRSRTYTEEIDGRKQIDPTADLGRQQRQQQFLDSLLVELGATKDPVALARAGAAMASGSHIDDAMGMGDIVTIVRRLGGGAPESVVLPTEPHRFGSAAALTIIEDEAAPVLQSMGADA